MSNEDAEMLYASQEIGLTAMLQPALADKNPDSGAMFEHIDELKTRNYMKKSIVATLKFGRPRK